jgi:hypothetical protein
MDKVRNLLLTTISTIGLPALVGILLGVPGMIVLITRIWHALTTTEQASGVNP